LSRRITVKTLAIAELLKREPDKVSQTSFAMTRHITRMR
jgi:hypothetical protein